MSCTNVTVSGTDPNCTEGKWYSRFPTSECVTGYQHPDLWSNGGGTCYCLSNAEAKAKLDAANGGDFGTDPLSLLIKYWYIAVAVVVLILISGRR